METIECSSDKDEELPSAFLLEVSPLLSAPLLPSDDEEADSDASVDEQDLHNVTRTGL